MAGERSGRFGIGVVGCGNVSMTYLRNAALFDGVALVACADLSMQMAERRAYEFGMRALPIEALLTDPAVDLILNLTVPAAHADVSMRALLAGKHVFTEKPLATCASKGRKLVATAESQGLLIGSAPDTFLGAAGRLARHLVDTGAIGRPVSGTACMFGRGMEHWHPNPAFYYQPGAGPLFDMGPYYLAMLVNLLGPVARVVAMNTVGQAERLITAEGPLQNTRFAVGTPTTVLAVLEFHSQTFVQFGTSWDVFRHSSACLELHGTSGSLQLPDPDTFGGVVSVSDRGAPWIDHDTADSACGADNWPFDAPDRANYRMLGVADLVRASRDGRQPRASGRLMLHVLEVMEAIERAAESGQRVDVEGGIERPPALSEAQVVDLLVRDEHVQSAR